MNKKNTLQIVFIFSLFALLFVLVAGMLYPFYTVILWAIFLYIILLPLYRWVISKINPNKKFFSAKRKLLSGVFSIGTLILIITPIIFLSIMLIQQLGAFLNRAEQFLVENPEFLENTKIFAFISDICERLEITIIDFDPSSIKTNIMGLIRNYSSKAVSIGTSVISGTGNFLVSLCCVVFSLYFFFQDGHYLGGLIAKAIPIDPLYMKTLKDKFVDITHKLFSGYIMVAFYEGLAAFILMTIFQVEGSLLFSVLLMVASFLPIVGATVVWIPVGLLLCLTVSTIKGILFLIIAGTIITLLDNFLRPMYLQDRINVHPLLIFFSILGGIKFFGINGLLLGPMIIILFFTVLDLLTEESKAEVLPVKEKKEQSEQSDKNQEKK
ncbi:MAG: AI-2E family transporter [Treponemataceae bacterium]|nr:AI-2E family transporter [Treponemataceae bacterium]